MPSPRETGNQFMRARKAIPRSAAGLAGPGTLTQKELGEILKRRVGTGSEATVIRTEKGERLPSAEEIQVLEELTGRAFAAFAGPTGRTLESTPATSVHVAAILEELIEQRHREIALLHQVALALGRRPTDAAEAAGAAAEPDEDQRHAAERLVARAAEDAAAAARAEAEAQRRGRRGRGGQGRPAA